MSEWNESNVPKYSENDRQQLIKKLLESLRNGKHFKIVGVPMVCYYLKDHKAQLEKLESMLS